MMRLKSAVLCLSIFSLTSTTLTFAQRNSPGHSGQNEKQVPKKKRMQSKEPNRNGGLR